MLCTVPRSQLAAFAPPTVVAALDSLTGIFDQIEDLRPRSGHRNTSPNGEGSFTQRYGSERIHLLTMHLKKGVYHALDSIAGMELTPSGVNLGFGDG